MLKVYASTCLLFLDGLIACGKSVAQKRTFHASRCVFKTLKNIFNILITCYMKEGEKLATLKLIS